MGYSSMPRPRRENRSDTARQYVKPDPEMEDYAHVAVLNYVTLPAIANGKLYVRTSECIHCYDLRAEGQ